MKYKLINTKTKEETLCEKVTIDGFDYYVSEKSSNDDYLIQKDFYIDLEKNKVCQQNDSEFMKFMGHTLKRILATNNPNIDIPKVVDEVEIKVDEILNKELPNFTPYHRRSFFLGYNKSQETHPFSEEDVEFFVKKVLEDAKKSVIWSEDYYKHLTKELLQLWKEQQPKIVYYE